eukprot:14873617-Ditylum_brightwellii.AAC.1
MKIHCLSPVMSKKAQYMNTSILIHQGLSLTNTLVKSNKDGRNSRFNKMFLPKQVKAQQWLAQNLSMDMLGIQHLLKPLPILRGQLATERQLLSHRIYTVA